MTPFAQRGSAVLLEDIAAVEMTVLIEVVVDRGMDGSEFLQSLYISELRHRSFSSPKRLVRILGSIVKPPTAFLTLDDTHRFHRRAVGPKPVGHDPLRPTVTLHRAPKKRKRSSTIPALRSKDLKHLAFVIDGTPQVMRLAVDPDEHLVQVLGM